MSGPQPESDRDYLMQIYHMMGEFGEKFEKHDHRICDLEKSVQAEILWRTRLIGVAAGIMAVLGLAITLLK